MERVLDLGARLSCAPLILQTLHRSRTMQLSVCRRLGLSPGRRAPLAGLTLVCNYYLEVTPQSVVGGVSFLWELVLF